MDRPITGFELDEEGHWTARLSCGHRQHVRHDPPLVTRPWVLEAASRNERLGMLLDCKLCDERRIPEGYVIGRELRFDAQTVPEGLLRQHRLKAGVWGRLCVLSGELRFHINGETEAIRSEGEVIIAPENDHHIELSADAIVHLGLYYPAGDVSPVRGSP